MNARILESVEPVWKHHCGAVQEALTEAAHALQELLRLDQYHRHGHEPETLGRTLGPLASQHLDLAALSQTLERDAPVRAMPADRLERVRALAADIEGLKGAWADARLDDSAATLEENETEILDRAEAHFDRLAAVFRAIRITQLEIRASYEPGRHDSLFAAFSWQQLGPGELRLSPPFIVTADFDTNSRSQLRKLVSLLESGMPLKFLVFRSGVDLRTFARSAPQVIPGLTLETLPLAMWQVYFAQAPMAGFGFEERLFAALGTWRSAVVSTLCARPDEDSAAFSLRAQRAVRSRAFPVCVYDPDRDPRFGACLDLSSNPSSEVTWIVERLAGSDADGAPFDIEEPFTFAHFAASEPGAEPALSAPSDVDDSLIFLTDYLALSRQQRMGKRPFIREIQADGQLVSRVVSDALVRACTERVHVWQMLQEISGVDNPHVKRSLQAVQAEVEKQKDEQLDQLRREMEKAATDRERAAIASTVRKLVARLTGVEPPGG